MLLFVPRPGLEKVLATFSGVGLIVRSKAEEIKAEAASRIHPVTGETAASGRVSAIPDGSRVSFGSAARYLEFGAYGRVYPFLRPAADAVVPGGRRST